MLAVSLGSTRGLCGAAELVGRCAEYETTKKKTPKQNTPFWQVQTTIKRNAHPFVSHFWCQEVSPTESEQCVALSRWLQKIACDASCTIKHGYQFANKSKRSCRNKLQRFCQSSVNLWYRSRRFKGVLLWLTPHSYLSLQHCCMSRRKKTSTKILTVGCYENPKRLYWRKYRTGKTGIYLCMWQRRR